MAEDDLSFEDKEEEPQKEMKQPTKFSDIFLSVLFFWGTSLLLVFLNKTILKEMPEVPFFITGVQLVVALVTFILYSGITGKCFYLSPRLLIKTLPLAGIYTMMLGTATVCLQQVDISLYQVARSFSLLFQYGFALGLAEEPPTLLTSFSCLVVFLGFLLSVLTTFDIPVYGLLMGLLASFSSALYGEAVKAGLSAVKNDERLLVHHVTFSGIFLLFGLVPFTNERVLLLSCTKDIFSAGNITKIVTSGLVGVLLVLATYQQIKVTSPLTHTISGTAKSCLQSLLSLLFCETSFSGLKYFGLFLSLFGSGLYSFSKLPE